MAPDSIAQETLTHLLQVWRGAAQICCTIQSQEGLWSFSSLQTSGGGLCELLCCECRTRRHGVNTSAIITISVTLCAHIPLSSQGSPIKKHKTHIKDTYSIYYMFDGWGSQLMRKVKGHLVDWWRAALKRPVKVKMRLERSVITM